MGEIINKIKIPDGVVVEINNKIVRVKSPRFELERKFVNPFIVVSKDNRDIVIKFVGKKFTRNYKRDSGSVEAHIKNMLKGVKEPYLYKLKICSGHFPMTVSVDSGFFIVKNFLGEKVPRKVKIMEGVDVRVEGDVISVSCPDKEKAGTVASVIEQSTIVTNRDRRVFQDGIYLVSKGEE